jgi:hypothetical protein
MPKVVAVHGVAWRAPDALYAQLVSLRTKVQKAVEAGSRVVLAVSSFSYNRVSVEVMAAVVEGMVDALALGSAAQVLLMWPSSIHVADYVYQKTRISVVGVDAVADVKLPGVETWVRFLMLFPLLCSVLFLRAFCGLGVLSICHMVIMSECFVFCFLFLFADVVLEVFVHQDEAGPRFPWSIEARGSGARVRFHCRSQAFCWRR